MEVLAKKHAPFHQKYKIPECHGNENNLISCLQSNTSDTVCNLLLVECKIALNTVIVVTDTTSTTVDGGPGGVPNAALAGIFGVIVVIIALIAGGVLLIVLLLKSKTHEKTCPNRSEYLGFLVRDSH